MKGHVEGWDDHAVRGDGVVVGDGEGFGRLVGNHRHWGLHSQGLLDKGQEVR